jgi:hypothetical protein
MEIKNYYKQNCFNLETGTYIKGIIKMSYAEWCKAYDHLRKEHAKATKYIETYRRDALSNALNTFERHEPFSIGVTGTYEIVKEYNLLNKYKNQNYAIIIN